MDGCSTRQSSSGDVWTGLIIGVGRALFVLAVLLPMMPAFHPRLASETQGSEHTPLLEPPGFLSMNCGRMTTIVSLLAHAAHGVIPGAFYEPLGAS